MPRPAAGVSGKGMPGRRHRTADRQPGAGNSHIGLYVRRDAEASQVTVPAPLLRQGFLREDSGPLERMPESGRPGACSQSISRPAGLRRVAQTASTRSGGRLFLSGCGLSCRPGRRPGGENRGRKRKTQGGRRDGKADAGFHTGRDIGRAGKTERESGRHKAGRRRDGKADAGFHTGRNIGRAEAEGESGRHKAGGGTGKRMRVFTQAGKRQAERAASRGDR